jgi:single-strand DNA-binding protein
MANFNRVILVGHLTRDVRFQKTPQGTSVAQVGLAVSDRVKKNGEWTDETTFVDITLWGRLAEIAAEYLAKGSPALFEGRLKLDTWESKEGQKQSKLKVVADRLQLLGSRSGGSGASSGNASGSGAAGTTSSQGYQAAAMATPVAVEEDGISEDEIPF